MATPNYTANPPEIPHTTVHSDVFDALKGQTSALSVYISLKRRAEKFGWNIDREQMAREAGVSINTFDKATRQLRDLGLIEVIPRYVPKGWGNDPAKIRTRRDAQHPLRTSNAYRVHTYLPGGDQ